MRVFMLGWEFPPFISGGLGTACYGLTKALDQLGVKVTFVLPRAVDSQYATHVKLLSPGTAQPGSRAHHARGRTEECDVPVDHVPVAAVRDAAGLRCQGRGDSAETPRGGRGDCW